MKEIKQNQTVSNQSNYEQKVEELEKKLEDLTNQLKRTLADYSNLEKRINNEKEEFKKFSNLNLLLKILLVYDGLEKTAQGVEDQGLKLVMRQFKGILDSEGLNEVFVEEFDPNKHEVIDVVSGDEDKILEVLEKGYVIGDRLVRPAKVRLMRKKEKEVNKE